LFWTLLGSVQALAPNLIADELTKLAQLKDARVLSEEEFLALKTKLIEDNMSSGAPPS
jgi:hypothetical protein